MLDLELILRKHDARCHGRVGTRERRGREMLNFVAPLSRDGQPFPMETVDRSLSRSLNCGRGGSAFRSSTSPSHWQVQVPSLSGPAADSAMTSYSTLIGSSVFAAFVDFHVVISHRHLPPRTRPLLCHGRVRRPAADGRQAEIQYSPWWEKLFRDCRANMCY